MRSIAWPRLTLVLLATATLAACAGPPSTAGGNGGSAGTAGGTAPQEDHAFATTPSPAEARAQGLALATFAGGCFWCEETAFEGLPGVRAVVSGYVGGSETRPTYEQVSSGATGHAEAVQVVFDPEGTTYATLLDVFWRNVDPFAAGRQFCDVGKQYRSGIFVHDAEQRRLAEETKRKVAERFGKPVVTEVTDAGTFWPAENYHQDYYEKNPVRYRTYRFGCGRDARLAELWGEPARH